MKENEEDERLSLKGAKAYYKKLDKVD